MKPTQTNQSSKKWVIALGIFVGVFLAGYFYVPFWPKNHISRSTVVIKSMERLGLPADPVYFGLQATALTREEFLKESAEIANTTFQLNNAHESSKDSIKVKTKLDSGKIEILVTSPDSSTAVEKANAIGNSLVEHWRASHQVRDIVERMTSEHDQLDQRASLISKAFSNPKTPHEG